MFFSLGRIADTFLTRTKISNTNLCFNNSWTRRWTWRVKRNIQCFWQCIAIFTINRILYDICTIRRTASRMLWSTIKTRFIIPRTFTTIGRVTTPFHSIPIDTCTTNIMSIHCLKIKRRLVPYAIVQNSENETSSAMNTKDQEFASR